MHGSGSDEPLCEFAEEPLEEGVVVLRVSGELDYSVAPLLSRRLRQAIERAPRGVVLDLRETSFFDSSALHALVEAREAAERRGRRLAVVCTAPHLRRVFRIAMLEDHLRVGATREEALERLSAGG